MLWDPTFVNDEIWLRVRRVLIDELESAGCALDAAGLRDAVGEQRVKGHALLAEARDEIGADWVETLESEQFLRAGARRFQLRLPLILAFGGSYAEALMELVPELPENRARSLRLLVALFNLGIVLVDAIMDDPESFGDVRLLFGDGGAALTAVRGKFSRNEVSGSISREFAVLGRLVDHFFAGVAVLADNRRGPVFDRLDRLLAESYEGQLASVASPERPGRARAKSVCPFLVAPSMLDIALGSGHNLLLEAIATDVGEAFWRVDDLVDASRDFVVGEPNLLAARLGPRDRRRLGIDLLQSDLIEQVAHEAVGHFVAAIARTSERGLACERLRRWITLYVFDWLR